MNITQPHMLSYSISLLSAHSTHANPLFDFDADVPPNALYRLSWKCFRRLCSYSTISRALPYVKIRQASNSISLSPPYQAISRTNLFRLSL